MENDKSTPEFDPFETEKEKPRRGGAALAFLALLIALGVAGWNGWQWWQARGAASEADTVAEALSRIDEGQARVLQAQQEQARRLDAVERLEMESGLARLDEAIEQARSVAGSDRARLANLEASLQEALARLDGLESRIAAVVVRGESPRQGLELAEVDYLLRSAHERLRLYGDARTADQALALADAQLAAMDDPVYLTVRQAIAAARGSLEDVSRPDPIALTETLDRLQSRIPGLPFPGEVTVTTEAGDLETEEDPGVWARFKAAVGGLVSVRRRDEDATLISLEDKDYLRQGLWLQLEAARLALLREDAAAWSVALARADAALETYFDTDAPQVERFGEGLERLAGAELTVDWPDISEPWTRLQGIRSVDAPPSPEASSAPDRGPEEAVTPPSDGSSLAAPPPSEPPSSAPGAAQEVTEVQAPEEEAAEEDAAEDRADGDNGA